MRKDFNYNMSSYEFTTFSREDNYNGSLIVKILFFFSAARRKDEEEASTATTTTTKRPAARGRDINRKQLHSPWDRVFKIWYKRSYKADSNRTYNEESNCAGGGTVQKMPSMFSPGGGGGGVGGCTSSNSLLGCHPTLQILTQVPISDQYLSLPLEKTREIMIM